MNIGLRQIMSQQQRLIMTPKLQQAINVLLMSRLDLVQHLSQQLEDNPLLDEVQEEVEIEEIKEEELDPDAQWNEPEEIVDREDKEPDIDWEMSHFSSRLSKEPISIGIVPVRLLKLSSE